MLGFHFHGDRSQSALDATYQTLSSSVVSATSATLLRDSVSGVASKEDVESIQ